MFEHENVLESDRLRQRGTERGPCGGSEFAELGTTVGDVSKRLLGSG